MKNKTLCLLWQNQKTRQWYHVANLTLNDKRMYSFSYERDKKKRGLEEALQNGYHLHPSFPEKLKNYESSKLFSAFSRRLPHKARPDYMELLRENNLNINDNEFDLLTMTGGKLISDNYEFVKPVKFKDEFFTFDFYVRGWRHYNDEKQQLNDLAKISLEIDEGNEQDPDAVMVKYEGEIIGYVPAFYSEFIKNVIENNLTHEITSFRFNNEASSHRKVNIVINGRVANKKKTEQKVDLLVAV